MPNPRNVDPSKSVGVTLREGVIDWLLEPSNPPIRYLTLTQLLRHRESDGAVREAKKEIPESPWVRELMVKQIDDAYWDNPKSCYLPKYGATVWYLQLLAELGVTADRRIQNACQRFLKQHTMADGGFTCGSPAYRDRFSEECIAGRMVAVLVKFGYLEEPRVWDAVEWLLGRQMADGGWNCDYRHNPSHSSIYSTYQVLWGLSEIPSSKRTPSIKRAIGRGVEFMLVHRLFKSHRTLKTIKPKWLVFKFPPHVRYDILHSLRLLTDLGVTKDNRLDDALEAVESKKQPGGVWLLDAVPRSPNKKRSEELTIELEKEGLPSKWTTLTALTVLTRTGRVDPKMLNTKRFLSETPK
ncbi:MAG: prenyltransferase/squalene oxidase repeat-containing protein [Candidatus Geothermarchaeales archaeon]